MKNNNPPPLAPLHTYTTLWLVGTLSFLSSDALMFFLSCSQYYWLPPMQSPPCFSWPPLLPVPMYWHLRQNLQDVKVLLHLLEAPLHQNNKKMPHLADVRRNFLPSHTQTLSMWPLKQSSWCPMTYKASTWFCFKPWSISPKLPGMSCDASPLGRFRNAFSTWPSIHAPLGFFTYIPSSV